MTKFKTCKSIVFLADKIKGFDSRSNAIYQLFSFLRWDYYARNSTKELEILLKRASIMVPKLPELPESIISQFKKLTKAEMIQWDNWSKYLEQRIHLNKTSSQEDFELLFNLLPITKALEKSLLRIISEGTNRSSEPICNSENRFYDLSILPLNFLLGNDVLEYFIPPPDYFIPHPTKKFDPYGIIFGKSRAKIGMKQPTVVNDPETGLIIGSHKFSHSLLFNVDFYCPIGCAGCYKTRMGTREYLSTRFAKNGFKPKIYHHLELGELNSPSIENVEHQAELAVLWMNENPRGQQVYDVIVSGGEPLCMSNKTIKAILNKFQDAKNLRIFRICTGTLFLGLPFRIDDELLDTLKDFSDSTGVRVTIQAHLGNHRMITPESVMAIQKIRKRGIPIYTQTPIKNGVNFFLNKIEKTLEYLGELGRLQVLVGVDPYMFIMDMHPSTNAYYVPIEPMIQMWSILVESHDYVGLERPRTLSALFENGNIILSGDKLFSASKFIDNANDRVIYYIPRIGTEKNWKPDVAEIFKYEEPLIKGINDNPDSLEVLKQQLYSNLRNKITAAKEK